MANLTYACFLASPHLAMPLYDECFVLLPASTLEDFPVGLPESDARSLLAAWTLLWHPQLIAGSAAMPAWYRADEPPAATVQADSTQADSPTEPKRRVIAVPQSSISMLPADYKLQCSTHGQAVWLSGSSRQEMLDQLPIDQRYNRDPLAAKNRSISVEDFFALGYAYLQVQILTRRLRYTSNLDQIYFESCVLQAAEAFTGMGKPIDGEPSFTTPDAEAAVAAMHDAFDCLAQERDHYFASDPHLIDLTLLSTSTLDSFFAQLPIRTKSPKEEQSDAATDTPKDGVLATPHNVLIDAGVCPNLTSVDPQKLEALRDCFENKSWGWAGGGPNASVSLATKTYTESEQQIIRSFQQTTDAVGIAPPVYARYSGLTPRDMIKTIASLDVAGMISVDFENGTGFTDEAKVLQSGSGVELQTLSAKPIDASSESVFLDFTAVLGQAVDRGEIAAALLVHWPQTQSDTYKLIERVASWSLVLGRMWTLDDFFRLGEQPYHHSDKLAANERADLELSESVSNLTPNPLSSQIEQTRVAIGEQNKGNLRALITLATGKETLADSGASDCNQQEQLVRAVGLTPSAANSNICLINPTSSPQRANVEIDGDPHLDKHVYAASGHGKQSIVTADVSAFGFSVIRNQGNGSSPTRSLGSRLGGLFTFGGGAANRKPIAADHLLQNAFMEVALDPQSGGVKGVYCGETRGNRFSLRLVGVDAVHDEPFVMKANRVKTKVARPDLGIIESSGVLVNSDGEKVADFELAYQLERGSRMLNVSVKIEPLRKNFAKPDPWQNYFAIRAAVATEAMMPRSIARDKIHKPSRRRIVSPLGVILDESERQTLIASAGLPYHRRIDDRFLDTLLFVQGETQHQYQIHYGFDIKDPVGAARGVVAPPLSARVESVDADASRGWLIHASPKEVLISDVSAWTDSQGTMFALVRLIQTRPRSITAALRFCRPASEAITMQTGGVEPPADPMQAFATAPDKRRLSVEDDCIKIPMQSHEVVDCLVRF